MSKLHSACTNDEGDQDALLRVRRVFERIRTSSVRAHECTMARKSCESQAHTWNSRDCETLLFLLSACCCRVRTLSRFFSSRKFFFSLAAAVATAAACLLVTDLFTVCFPIPLVHPFACAICVCINMMYGLTLKSAARQAKDFECFQTSYFSEKDSRIVTISSSFHRSLFSTFLHSTTAQCLLAIANFLEFTNNSSRNNLHFSQVKLTAHWTASLRAISIHTQFFTYVTAFLKIAQERNLRFFDEINAILSLD